MTDTAAARPDRCPRCGSDRPNFVIGHCIGPLVAIGSGADRYKPGTESHPWHDACPDCGGTREKPHQAEYFGDEMEGKYVAHCFRYWDMEGDGRYVTPEEIVARLNATAQDAVVQTQSRTPR